MSPAQKRCSCAEQFSQALQLIRASPSNRGTAVTAALRRTTLQQRTAERWKSRMLRLSTRLQT